VTIRAMPGEAVLISGADLVEGWQREPDGSWSAPLASAPKRLLRDGRPWTAYSFDSATRRLEVQGGDPRLHTFENVVREQSIDLSGRESVRIEGIGVVHTLKPAP
jgi:hypothetical protein